MIPTAIMARVATDWLSDSTAIVGTTAAMSVEIRQIIQLLPASHATNGTVGTNVHSIARAPQLAVCRSQRSPRTPVAVLGSFIR